MDKSSVAGGLRPHGGSEKIISKSPSDCTNVQRMWYTFTRVRMEYHMLNNVSWSDFDTYVRECETVLPQYDETQVADGMLHTFLTLQMAGKFAGVTLREFQYFIIAMSRLWKHTPLWICKRIEASTSAPSFSHRIDAVSAPSTTHASLASPKNVTTYPMPSPVSQEALPKPQSQLPPPQQAIYRPPQPISQREPQITVTLPMSANFAPHVLRPPNPTQNVAMHPTLPSLRHGGVLRMPDTLDAHKNSTPTVTSSPSNDNNTSTSPTAPMAPTNVKYKFIAHEHRVQPRGRADAEPPSRPLPSSEKRTTLDDDIAITRHAIPLHQKIPLGVAPFTNSDTTMQQPHALHTEASALDPTPLDITSPLRGSRRVRTDTHDESPPPKRHCGPLTKSDPDTIHDVSHNAIGYSMPQ